MRVMVLRKMKRFLEYLGPNISNATDPSVLAIPHLFSINWKNKFISMRIG